MLEEMHAPGAPHRVDDLRAVARNLPPADDLTSEPPATTAAGERPRTLREALTFIFLRVRWPALAVLVTMLLALIGARIANDGARSDVQRWALTMLAMTGVLALIMLLDTALQRSERVTFDLLEKHEAPFLAVARRGAEQMFDRK
jgi:hypothetical protein